MPTPSRTGPDRGRVASFRRLVHATLGLTVLLVVVGGVVRVSDSGLGCGPAGSGTEGWPLCGGRLIPFLETGALIEYTHRILAAAVGALVILIAWRALREMRELRFVVRASVVTAVLVLAQGGLGGLTVENNLDELLVAAHLGLAMAMLGLLLAISWAARPDRAGRADARSGPLVRSLAVVTSVLVLATIVAGGYLAGTEEHGTGGHVQGRGAHLACGKEFPSCNGAFMPFGDDRLVDIHLAHRGLMYLAVVALLALLLIAARRDEMTGRLQAAGLVLGVQVPLGALNVWAGEHATLVVAHLTAGTLLWMTVAAAALETMRVPRTAGRRAGATDPEASTAAA